jgi:type I restriction enzyme R subunit
MGSEADTCRTLVLPKLYAAGWTDEQLAEQRTYTAGRIVPKGQGGFRKKPKRTDYLLRYTRDFFLAVVEAKQKFKNAADGLQQAKECAQDHGLQFCTIAKDSEELRQRCIDADQRADITSKFDGADGFRHAVVELQNLN